MGYVKRRASTKAKVTVQDFEDVKAQFLLDIKAVAEMDEVPSRPDWHPLCPSGSMDNGEGGVKESGNCWGR